MTTNANDPNNETNKAHAAFVKYCGLGPDRSLAKLAAEMGKPGSTRTFEEWSRKFNWQKRAREYDAEILQKEADEKERKRQKEIDRMNERHALIGTTQQNKAIKQIEKLIDAEKFGSLASVQLLKLAIEVERGARELPDQKIEIAGKDGGPIVIKTTWGTPKVERNKDE
jgi:hypothetical protein